MSTHVKTAKACYEVEAVAAPANGEGPVGLVVRSPAGKKRTLTVKEVGRARFDSAVAHFLASHRTAGGN